MAKELGWLTRLAVVISALWVAVIYAFSIDERESLQFTLILGVAPVAFLWGIAWIVRGYLQQKKRKSPPDPAAAAQQRAAWVRRLAGFALLVTALSSIYYFSGHVGYDPAERLGEFVGYYIWLPLVAWGAWSYALKQSRGSLLLLIGTAYVLAGGWEIYKLDREHRELMVFAKSGASLMAQMAGGHIVTRQQILDAHFGRFEPLMLGIDDYYSTINGVLSDYGKRLAGANVSSFLSPSSVAEVGNITSSRAAIGQLQTLTLDTEGRLTSAIDRMTIQLKSVDMPVSARPGFMAGLDRSTPEAKAAFRQYFYIERQTLSELDSVLSFLQAKHGSYVVAGNRILFRKQADLDKYNAYLSKINSLAAEEVEWRRAAQSKATSKLRQLVDEAPQH